MVISTDPSYTFTPGKSRTFVANFKQYHYVSKTAGCNGNTPCYATIQAALNAAADGDIIMVGQGIFNEAPTKNTAGKVIINGSWNSAFTDQVPWTTSMNAPSASQGAVVLREVVLIP